MGSLAHDYDLLLSAPNPVESELAKSVLAEHGIPSFSSGADRDMAELGSVAHSAITRPDLYVPKGLRDRAQALLDEAWSANPLEGDATESEVSGEPDSQWSSGTAIATVAPRASTGWTMLLAVVAVGIAFAVLWAFAKA